jgi:hypothetical protein
LLRWCATPCWASKGEGDASRKGRFFTENGMHMNLVSLFRGKEAGEILKEVVGGTRFVPAIQEALTAKPKSPEPKK